jgi:amino acid transporter
MLSTQQYAPLVSWVTGWLTLVGNWTVTLSINFSGAQLILSAITLWDDSCVAIQWQTVLTFWAIMVVAFAVNAFGAKYLDLINKICIYWTSASVIVIIITVLVMSDDRRNAKFVFAHFDASASGWPSGWAWFVGLLQAACKLSYVLFVNLSNSSKRHIDGLWYGSCYVRRSTETRTRGTACHGSVGSGSWHYRHYLIPILFVLPDVGLLLRVANGQPIGLVFKIATGSSGGGFGLLFLILGILCFAGVGELTAASRCTYAFARDGATPGSRLWSRVDKRSGVPLWGLMLSTIIDCVLGCIVSYLTRFLPSSLCLVDVRNGYADC